MSRRIRCLGLGFVLFASSFSLEAKPFDSDFLRPSTLSSNEWLLAPYDAIPGIKPNFILINGQRTILLKFDRGLEEAMANFPYEIIHSPKLRATSLRPVVFKMTTFEEERILQEPFALLFDPANEYERLEKEARIPLRAVTRRDRVKDVGFMVGGGVLAAGFFAGCAYLLVNLIDAYQVMRDSAP